MVRKTDPGRWRQRSPAASDQRETLFEIRRVGETLRVAAIDVADNVEVVVFGPVTAEAALRGLARQKLVRALGRAAVAQKRGG